jgi:hypothetical protein
MKKIKCEIYSRISGYYRPVQQYNKGKQEEFSERKKIKVPEVILNEVSDKNIQVQKMRD